jgi:hypothetical protein
MVRSVFHLFLFFVVTCIMGIGGLATAKRVHTGSWSFPGRDDVAWLRHMISSDRQIPRVIYLERQAITIKGGFDRAADHHSQLIELGVERALPGFTGDDRKWRSIVQCVRGKFADFEVVVTDRRPRQKSGYVMVHVGGAPNDLYGAEREGMGGVAPFNSDVIADSVVFAFSETLDNRVDSVCNTVAHEIGHIYGLDHSYRCNDVMTYLSGCGKKQFVHANVRCGESDRRDCDNGGATQNSHEHLLAVLGSRKRARTR